MYILLVSATKNEVAPSLEWLQKAAGEAGGNEVEVLITGVGSAATAYALGKQLQQRTPELIIQAGIAGSFKEDIAPGDVVAVKEEIFADLGAFDGNSFADIFDLGLADASERPFSRRLLLNPRSRERDGLNIPWVCSATVNCISSLPHQLQAIVEKYDPDIESMEGAAFHYTCLMEELPFLQIRAISNYAGDRDKKNWKIPEAIAALNDQVKKILSSKF